MPDNNKETSKPRNSIFLSYINKNYTIVDITLFLTNDTRTFKWKPIYSLNNSLILDVFKNNLNYY